MIRITKHSSALGEAPNIRIKCRSAKVKGAVQELGTKNERLFARSRILHEFAKRLRVG